MLIKRKRFTLGPCGDLHHELGMESERNRTTQAMMPSGTAGKPLKARASLVETGPNSLGISFGAA